MHVSSPLAGHIKEPRSRVASRVHAVIRKQAQAVNYMSLQAALAAVCLVWYASMLTVALCGCYCIATRFTAPPKPDAYATSHGLEPVTVIRPIKGLDPELTSCLESSFLQQYPPSKLQILFCVHDPNDPAVPILHELAAKYPHIDCDILVSAPHADHYGPNPKVNNLAKGFLAAKHDLLWIMDSNVWASPHILANSVSAMVHNTNCQQRLPLRSRKVKLVHHVPLALALDHEMGSSGSLLDEMFLFTSHSKFYVSLNNLSIAPCVNGKSNMYRRSDLDYAVSRIPHQGSPFFRDPSVVQDARVVTAKGPGHSIEFFAKYIGEDNMIGIALWEYCRGRTALTGDVVIQPLKAVDDSNSTREYSNRRVRWLRVRKYMVLAATLVEPTTESIICGIMGTFALSTLFWDRTFSPWFFAFHMICWLVCDYFQYSIWEQNIATAAHATTWLCGSQPLYQSKLQWLQMWIMRELFALPIWIMAMAGHEISWRGKPFMIKKDLTAEEI